MALKALLLGKDLGQKRKALAELETRSADFEKRTADLTAAIEEMTEETTQEQRDAVSERSSTRLKKNRKFRQTTNRKKGQTTP